MKKFIFLFLAACMSLFSIPTAVNSREKMQSDRQNLIEAAHSQTESLVQSTEEQTFASEGVDSVDGETIVVFMPSAAKAEKLNMRDYIIGVVAAEMPVVYESDALSAQALASVTLARRFNIQGGSKELDGAVIAADPSKHQGYMSVDEMKKRWGDDFDEYYKKLCNAVDKVIDYTVLYENQPALTVFHAISPGLTETAAEIWGAEVKYLTNVDSSGDKLSPGFASSITVSTQEFCKKLSIDINKVDSDSKKMFSDAKYSKAGTLISVNIGGKNIAGNTIRSVFMLRSSAVKLSEKDGKITLSVSGYGHGVGLSQYGADYLARQGQSWKEIILHYYPGTKTEKYNP